MIHSIKVKNFYSIGEEISLNFVAKEKGISAPELYIDAPLGNKVTKAAFVGGPNASGKTNVLRALAFLRFIITGNSGSALLELPYTKFVTISNEPTELSVVFSVDDQAIYRYDLTLSTKQIVEEALSSTSMVAERASKKELFNRKWDINRGAYNIRLADKLVSIKQAANLGGIINLPDNYRNSFIFLGSIYDVNLAKIVDFWRTVLTNVLYTSSAESTLPIYSLAEQSVQTLMSSSDTVNFASDFLKKVDIGYDGFFEAKPEGPDKRIIYGIRHRYGRNKFQFDPMLESTGTNRLLYLLMLAAGTLTTAQGGVAIIDEADAFLHPDIYEKFVELFMSPETNKNNTQLILSSHNYTTLNYLDKQQIFLTERDGCGQTDVWRLDEVDGARADDNFYSKYMAGAYGAVPREDRI